jgi:hypothetical protein
MDTNQLANKLSDRQLLELSEARVLYSTYVLTKKKVMTQARIEYLEKRYGKGSVDRILNYMKGISNGTID